MDRLGARLKSWPERRPDARKLWYHFNLMETREFSLPSGSVQKFQTDVRRDVGVSRKAKARGTQPVIMVPTHRH